MKTGLAEISGQLIEKLTIAHWDTFDVFFSLILATVISILISKIYKFTHRGMNFELSYMPALVILAPIITTVMLFIRGDLVLSLGLIGSLSIIRFRTPVKDTRDMAFLFWVIITGLGCGTFNWAVVIISAIFIAVTIIVLHFIKFGYSTNSDYILVVSGISPYRPELLESILKKNARHIKIRSHESYGEQWEIIFELSFAASADNRGGFNGMIQELKTIDGVQQVSLLAPQLALPV